MRREQPIQEPKKKMMTLRKGLEMYIQNGLNSPSNVISKSKDPIREKVWWIKLETASSKQWRTPEAAFPKVP